MLHRLERCDLPAELHSLADIRKSHVEALLRAAQLLRRQARLRRAPRCGSVHRSRARPRRPAHLGASRTPDSLDFGEAARGIDRLQRSAAHSRGSRRESQTGRSAIAVACRREYAGTSINDASRRPAHGGSGRRSDSRRATRRAVAARHASGRQSIPDSASASRRDHICRPRSPADSARAPLRSAASINAVAARHTVEKNGAHRSRRPICSISSAISTHPSPSPPYFSGMWSRTIPVRCADSRPQAAGRSPPRSPSRRARRPIRSPAQKALGGIANLFLVGGQREIHCALSCPPPGGKARIALFDKSLARLAESALAYSLQREALLPSIFVFEVAVFDSVERFLGELDHRRAL